jgi:RimJ/RimL family protein N-acetyltransferase
MATIAAAPRFTRPPAIPGIAIRPFRPPDAPLLDEVLDGLGMDSRYTRFHGPKPRMSASERAYLAGTDDHDHVAYVAVDDSGAALAVARFVRDRTDSGTAEVAAEVIDARQRQGLGTEMMARLARRALAGGIRTFTATVLAQTGMARSLRRRGWRAIANDGLTVTLEIETWRIAARP